MLQDRTDTRNMSLKENAVRGAEVGGVVGALLALTIPGIGPVLAIGPLLSAFSGAMAGGAVGGLVGASGAFRPVGLPEEVADRLQHRVNQGDILIAVHSDDEKLLNKAARVFKTEHASFIYDGEQQAA